MQLVTDDTTLRDICAQLSLHTVLAVDTEFLRERTYYAQLGLIQIASEDLACAIDPLALNNLDPLKDLMFNPAITKVMHAGSQDMEIFYGLWGELPAPVQDSQLMGALLGLGEQISYSSLVHSILDVQLEKDQTRTDWTQRPLTDKQIDYAIHDVYYLIRAYPVLQQRLSDLGRTSWLDEDFAALSDSARYKADTDSAWKRVKGIQKLSGPKLAIVKVIARWREQEAISRNKPRRHILSDEAIVALAQMAPVSVKQLQSRREFSDHVIKRLGLRLIELAEEGRALPESAWPTLNKKQRLSPNQEAITDALAAIVKVCAHRDSISVNSLCSRKSLEKLVHGDRDLAVLQGWRKASCGHHLLEFIEGTSHIMVMDEKLTLGV